MHAPGMQRSVERRRGPVSLPLPRLALRQAHRCREGWPRAQATAALPHHSGSERHADRRHEPAERHRSRGERLGPEGPRDHRVVQLDLNFVLAAVSILMFVGFLAFFGYLIFHQQSLEPPEKTGAELIEQHYAAGETIEQPTPYYVAPIPAAPDPLEISANLDRKILVGAGMLFAVFALVGG